MAKRDVPEHLKPPKTPRWIWGAVSLFVFSIIALTQYGKAERRKERDAAHAMRAAQLEQERQEKRREREDEEAREELFREARKKQRDIYETKTIGDYRKWTTGGQNEWCKHYVRTSSTWELADCKAFMRTLTVDDLADSQPLVSTTRMGEMLSK